MSIFFVKLCLLSLKIFIIVSLKINKLILKISKNPGFLLPDLGWNGYKISKLEETSVINIPPLKRWKIKRKNDLTKVNINFTIEFLGIHMGLSLLFTSFCCFALTYGTRGKKFLGQQCEKCTIIVLLASVWSHSHYPIEQAFFFSFHRWGKCIHLVSKWQYWTQA